MHIIIITTEQNIKSVITKSWDERLLSDHGRFG